MGYLDNVNWEQLKKELQSELEKGLAIIKNGAIVMQKKAEELTEEGKRQYKMLSAKAKLHDAMRELGAKVYILLSNRGNKNPALDAGIKSILVRIKSLEAELAKLEGKAGEAASRAALKSRAAAHALARRKAGAAVRSKVVRRVKVKAK